MAVGILAGIGKVALGGAKMAGKAAVGGAKAVGKGTGRAGRVAARRANVQKIMGGGEKKEKAKITPKSFMGSSSGKKGKTPLSKVALKLKDVSNNLKDNLVLDKVKFAIDKRNREKQRAADREKELESQKKDKGGTLKGPLAAAKGFLDRITGFLLNFLWGAIVIKFIDLAKNPKVLGFINGVGKFIDDVSNFAVWALDAFASFVEFGYKLYDGVRGWVGNTFGPDGVKKFDTLMGNLNNLLNGFGIIGLVYLKFRKFFNKLIGNVFKIFRRGIGRAFKRLMIKFGGKWAGKAAQWATRLAQKGITVAKNFGGKLLKGGGTLLKNLGGKVGGKAAGKVGGWAAKIFGKAAKFVAPALKAAMPAAKGFFSRIPIVGPLVIAIISLLSGEPPGLAIFKALGAALGGALGTFIPIPIIGTLIGETIGVFVGDLLYSLLFGGGISEVGQKLKDTFKTFIKPIWDFFANGISRFFKEFPTFDIPNIGIQDILTDVLSAKWPGWLPWIGNKPVFGTLVEHIPGFIKNLPRLPKVLGTVTPFMAPLLMPMLEGGELKKLPQLWQLFNPLFLPKHLASSFFPGIAKKPSKPTAPKPGASAGGQTQADAAKAEKKRLEDEKRKAEWEAKKKAMKQKFDNVVANAKKGITNLLGGAKNILGNLTAKPVSDAFVVGTDNTALIENDAPGFLNALKESKGDETIELLRNYASYETGTAKTKFIPIPLPQVDPTPIPSPSGGGVSGSSKEEEELDPITAMLYMGK